MRGSSIPGGSRRGLARPPSVGPLPVSAIRRANARRDFPVMSSFASVAAGVDDLTLIHRAERPDRRIGDTLLEKPDRAVEHQDVGAPRVVAALRERAHA